MTAETKKTAQSVQHRSAYVFHGKEADDGPVSEDARFLRGNVCSGRYRHLVSVKRDPQHEGAKRVFGRRDVADKLSGGAGVLSALEMAHKINDPTHTGGRVIFYGCGLRK